MAPATAEPRPPPAAGDGGGGERILLVRTSALGDVVHALPVLTALARHRPGARLGWVVEGAMAPLLAGHPHLDETIVVRLREWRRRPGARATRHELGDAVARLRAFRADVALELMGNHKGGALALLSGARRRIGLTRRHRREPSSALWINQPVAPRGPHAVERGLSLLAALGLPEEEPDFGAEALLAAGGAGAAPPGDYALLHPGAAWGNKLYPPEMWGAAVAALRRGGGPPTRIVWGPGEEGLARRAAAASDGTATLLPGSGLAELAVQMRGARLVLGADTGPLHLARALGRPVLAVMGPTDPVTHGPWNRPGSALWRRLPCSFCHVRMESPRPCLTGLAPIAVAERALALLDGRARRS